MSLATDLTSDGAPIISVSGLRGIVGRSLTPLIVTRYVGAYAAWMQRFSAGSVAESAGRRVVVARDGRSSGPSLLDLVTATLGASGIDSLVADVAATPTVGVLIRALEADGGVQISASHNPPGYNGLKLFGSDGRVLPATLGNQVIAAYEAGEFAWRPTEDLGQRLALDDCCSAHLQLVLATVDVPRIRDRRFRVLLDSNHGSGSLLGAELLSALGCDFTIVGQTPDGGFAHPPEPTAENLAPVCRLALEHQAQVVFCQDPDADRLAIIDEQGRYIGEEYTLALTLNHALAQRQAAGFPMGPVVTNCSSSRMARDIADRYGVPCLLSKVGEANVTDLMLEKQAVYGGEGSGGPIDPRVGLVRDSFVGMAQVLDAMAATGLSVSGLADQLPRYHIHKTTVKLAADRPPTVAIAEALERLEQHFADSGATISKQDGLRLDWKDAWLLIRPSNTEPIVRAVAEAESPQRALELCRSAAHAIGS